MRNLKDKQENKSETYEVLITSYLNMYEVGHKVQLTITGKNVDFFFLFLWLQDAEYEDFFRCPTFHSQTSHSLY